MTTELIRVPATFYVDHESRDLWTPKAVKRTARHIWIEADDPAIPELLSDAEHYAEPGQFDREYFGLCSSARATMKALQAGPHTADLCAAWDGDGQAR